MRFLSMFLPYILTRTAGNGQTEKVRIPGMRTFHFFDPDYSVMLTVSASSSRTTAT